jgi:hypothetical protein
LPHLFEFSGSLNGDERAGITVAINAKQNEIMSSKAVSMSASNCSGVHGIWPLAAGSIVMN